MTPSPHVDFSSLYRLQAGNGIQYPPALKNQGERIQKGLEDIGATHSEGVRWSNLHDWSLSHVMRMRDYLKDDRENPAMKSMAESACAFFCYSYWSFQGSQKPKATIREILGQINTQCFRNPQSQHYNLKTAEEIDAWLKSVRDLKRQVNRKTNATLALKH